MWVFQKNPFLAERRGGRKNTIVGSLSVYTGRE